MTERHHEAGPGGPIAHAGGASDPYAADSPLAPTVKGAEGRPETVAERFCNLLNPAVAPGAVGPLALRVGPRAIRLNILAPTASVTSAAHILRVALIYQKHAPGYLYITLVPVEALPYDSERR